MSRVLVDTSVFIETERRNLQALERLDELMDEGPVPVSVVTVVELLASPTLSAERRRFYVDFFAAQVEVLPASAAGAVAGLDAALAAGGGPRARHPDSRDGARARPEGADGGRRPGEAAWARGGAVAGVVSPVGTQRRYVTATASRR